ncbi:MAG TPA: S-formylglutathione hydrolase [Gammaproteobacteria bacterium]
MQELEKISESRCFEGRQITFRHRSEACGCDMRFAVYLPPAAEQRRVPVVYWLSGLTCTEENFSVKSGAQRYAAELGLALVIPDTSPRGVDIPGQDDVMEVGSGAGFYVNATAAPWAAHYRMYDYVSDELVRVVNASLPVDPERMSISGHSMGGHGALLVGLRNADRYRSISAFAPISSAARSAWGRRAFAAYFGPDEDAWRDWDASAVIERSPSRHELLVDQGGADPFLGQLRPGDLQEACRKSGQKLTFRERPGYDHGYFFVATFIGEHLRFHAAALESSA